MKANREDVVQAALIVERWCSENCSCTADPCDCPFSDADECYLYNGLCPGGWNLENKLRTRGLKHD